jgi:hypothetical protein
MKILLFIFNISFVTELMENNIINNNKDIKILDNNIEVIEMTPEIQKFIDTGAVKEKFYDHINILNTTIIGLIILNGANFFLIYQQKELFQNNKNIFLLITFVQNFFFIYSMIIIKLIKYYLKEVNFYSDQITLCVVISIMAFIFYIFIENIYMMKLQEYLFNNYNSKKIYYDYQVSLVWINIFLVFLSINYLMIYKMFFKKIFKKNIIHKILSNNLIINNNKEYIKNKELTREALKEIYINY